jgi:4-amino-4-deoxy-L-arabinose transferase-like glycosyltransferase
VIAMLLAMCTTSDTSDGQLLLILPGLVMLAAFGLPTLRRGNANAFDWFSLLLYSVTGLLIWFTWFTKMTGIPGGFARSLARLTPGAVYHFRPLEFLLALMATIAWLALVRWRIVSHPKVLWRSVVLASGGVIFAWTLMSTLFIYTINYGRTYRDVATELTSALAVAQRTPEPTERARKKTAVPKDVPSNPSAPGSPCVATDGVGLAQRASFAWFGGLRFSHVDYSGRNVDECDYLLRQDLTRNQRADSLPSGKWKLLWEGRRAADRDELFRLFRKSGSATTKGAVDAIDRNDSRDAPFNAPPQPPATPAPTQPTPSTQPTPAPPVS